MGGHMKATSRFTQLRRREDGAEAVEFAIIGPLLFFVVFGLIYLLLLFAAQISLGYATNVGVRYAAIPTSPGAYPPVGDVVTAATAATPFFNSSTCTPSLDNAVPVNQPVTLTMECSFPNPAGGAANGLKNLFYGGGDDYSTTVDLSATAQSRKE